MNDEFLSDKKDEVSSMTSVFWKKFSNYEIVIINCLSKNSKIFSLTKILDPISLLFDEKIK